MRKVLHLIETLGAGGAERALYTALSAINTKGRVKSIVCCLFKKGPFAYELERIGIPVFNISMTSPYDWRKGIFGLARIIKENEIDIVHTHLFYANIYGRIAGRLGGAKTIITTLHNPDYTYEDNGRISFRIRKLIDKYTGIFLNTRFIAVSYAVKKDYEKHMGFKDIDVIYNSINPCDFQIDHTLDVQRERAALGLRKDDFVLLNIGRLHPQKGQIYLLGAMEGLIEKDARFKLLIVGKGPLKDALQRQIVQKGLTKNVFLLGERSDIPKLLQLADVFVFPSIYEAFGIVAVEAMAMEKLIAASRIEGLREVIGLDTAVYIDPCDSEDIARVIMDIYNNVGAYKDIKVKARQRALNLFDVQKNTEKLEQIYLKSEL